PTGQALPSAPQNGTTGQSPGQTLAGLPPGAQVPSGIGVQSGASPNAIPGSPAGGLPPGFQTQPNAPPAAAANLINQILTSPRPGGLNGLGQPGADPTQGGQSAAGFGNNAVSTLTGNGATAAAGQVIGGGFAGVASKDEREGIKIYRERTSY